MVFSSYVFLHIFLPSTLAVVLCTHFFLGVRVANLALLLASLVFYMWGIGAAFVGVLTVSILFNYLLGLAAECAVLRADQSRVRLAVAASVVCNLGILGYFKYANFFVGEFSGLMQLFDFSPPVWEEVILPIGISFFTFQAMSYTFDIAKAEQRAQRDPLAFALYIVLFPQLIAGPIVRYGVIAQELVSRRITIAGCNEGALRFLHGLIKKVVVADAAGLISETAFASAGGEGLTAPLAWAGALAFAVQIYFDFSGYSDMAIGLGRIFGFQFPENFNKPYTALSITDFWRRWHITLSSWFRDYLYIPLGGSWGSVRRIYLNLITVFVLTGVWHGANWTFLIWGLFHGGLLILERLTGARMLEKEQIGSPQRWLLRRALTSLLVVLGWVVFWAPDLETAAAVYEAMFSFRGLEAGGQAVASLPPIELIITIFGFVISASSWRVLSRDAYYSRRVGDALVAALYLIALPVALIKVAGGDYSPFLYFQF